MMNEWELDICAIGLNHKVAPVEVREQVALSAEEIDQVLPELLMHEPIQEAMILSTCNRTELYGVGRSALAVEEQLRHFLQHLRPAFYRQYGDALYVHSGLEAVRHLFRVAAGMDSMMLGEPQILGQVKQAYQQAVRNRTAGIILNRLLDFALIAGKRVRSETELGKGAVSVPYAAVELAGKIFGDFSQLTALLLGAGEMGVLVARHLREKGIGQLLVSNRSQAKAQQLARELGAMVIPFPQVNEALMQADMVIGTTGAPGFVLQADQLRTILHRRGMRPLYLMDIAVPRDFDPQLARFENVFLHDIDDLENIVQRNLASRRKELPRAEEIVQQECRNFQLWKNTLQVKPTIVALRNQLEAVRQMELEKIRHKVTREEFEKIDRFSRSFLNKILHQPIAHLRRLSNGSREEMEHVEMVRKMFNLGQGAQNE